MEQKDLVQHALQGLTSTPTGPAPADGTYLTLEAAQEIVDETIAYVSGQADQELHEYLKGHRKRLAHSLALIPKAKSEASSCLDVGCYGYMAFWAWKYLGYRRVDGIELRPDVADAVILRNIELNGETLELKAYNFDLAAPDWPLRQKYDTVLFFETLEHINTDPMGVMANINHAMAAKGILVMSVPNAVSYKTLKEFLCGMPPWTYWFYHPDLAHEPRHCFEYTPIVFKVLLEAAGFDENYFCTIYAYSDPDSEVDVVDIAESLSLDLTHFGETMIAQVRKADNKVRVRYPDVLYDPTAYYENAYPFIRPILDATIKRFRESAQPQRGRLTDENYSLGEENTKLMAEADRLRAINSELRARNDELMFLCDRYLRALSTTSSGPNLASAQADLEAVRASLSWRITAPLRKSFDLFGNVSQTAYRLLKRR